MKYTKEELDELVRALIQSYGNAQEFMDVFSLGENWDVVDKKVKIPREVGFYQGECPRCDKTIRTLFNKFCGGDVEYKMKCPHCKEELECRLEFTGWTCDLNIF